MRLLKILQLPMDLRSTAERSVGNVRKKLPIGIENFSEFSTEDFYYVDKTLFIAELGESKSIYPPKTIWKIFKHEHVKVFF